jgi:phosphomannomutase
LTPLSCFKAYDLRGRVPEELDAVLACRLGQAFAQRFRPKTVALGRDVRHSSLELLQALAQGLVREGVSVIDLGLCGTEELYWAAQQPGIDGGIQVTGSHNPIDHNGMKLVLAGAVPVSGDSGLRELEAMVAASQEFPPGDEASMIPRSYRESYLRHLLSYVDVVALRRLRIVVNAGNGGAGVLIDALEPLLPFEFIKIHHEPDGDFPHGIPNPLLSENRGATGEAVRWHGADFGVAWDADFDRCFVFDERGSFIEGYYIVGLLAEAMLAKHPGEKIIHDPRLIWNTQDIVAAAGGIALQCKTGHAFIKERMRAENAVYGGEMSAHHYFRDFAYCDNGNIPWLLVAALLSGVPEPLSSLVDARIARFPSSGEINLRVADVAATLARIESLYRDEALRKDDTDGLGLEFGRWRFNLRGSNTEPLIRLNVETHSDRALLREKTALLRQQIAEA